MNADRWRQVKAVCHAALGRAAAERHAFLDEVCAGDTALRRDVEALIAHESDAREFLETPAWTTRPESSEPAAGAEDESEGALSPTAPKGTHGSTVLHYGVAAPGESDALSLVIGTRLGPYEVVGTLGEGGMGEVYKARDTRLGRTVAIKVLPPDLAVDPDRRRRFEQEARAVSALNHPHICTLHDIGEAQVPGTSEVSGRPDVGAGFSRPVRVSYLVMEHLAGQTLAERLRKGPLPLEQALECGAQIADGLSAAHKQGIIHRDLKPANIMLTKSGAKLLDFGLAKLRAGSGLRAAGYGPEPSAPATKSEPVTGRGVIVGTLPYMAPEQLEGKPTDARTDLWALGAILYEMLAGRRAFEGDSSAKLVGAILEHDPEPLTACQPLTPPAVDRVVRRCLAKDPEARWQDAADLTDELRWLARGADAASAGTTQAPDLSSARRTSWLASRALAVVLSAGVIGSAVLFRTLTQSPAAPRAERLTISLAERDLPLAGDITVSPDGKTIVFKSTDGRQSRLYRRHISEWDITPLEGTEGAFAPSFSPDGSSVVFATWKGLQRVPIAGGPSTPVYPNQDVALCGQSWGRDGWILFSRPNNPDTGIWRVRAEGGLPEVLLQPDEAERGGALRYLWPQMLPGGRAILFTILDHGRASIAAFFLGGPRRLAMLVDGGSHARYLPETGQLIYQTNGSLFAVPFDPQRLTATGVPYPVVRHVGNSDIFTDEYDVSATGTLVYVPASTSRLWWVDRQGVRTAIPARVDAPVSYLALSAAGDRAVLSVVKGPARKLYVANLGGDVTLTPLASSNEDYFGVFTRDGTQVLFTSAGIDNRFNVYSTRADAGGAPVRQTYSPNWHAASSVGAGGDTFLYQELVGGHFDIWEQELGKPNTARPVIKTADDELEAVISPNGRWLAYQSNASGQFEVYVQGYPDGPRSVVSTNGGQDPVWNPKGGELFYRASTGVFTVRIVNGARAGSPRRVFELSDIPTADGWFRTWDVAPDGEHFLVAENTRVPQIHVITHWFEELKAQMRGRQ